MPILRDAGVPATFFLCGASLGAPKSAWWERLQRAVQRGRSPASLAELLPQGANVRNKRAIDIQVLGQAVEALAPDQRSILLRTPARTSRARSQRCRVARGKQ